MCGLAGILNYGNSFNMSSWARALAINSAVRGTDATGYAYALGDSIVVNKRGVKADKLKFTIPNNKHKRKFYGTLLKVNIMNKVVIAMNSYPEFL